MEQGRRPRSWGRWLCGRRLGSRWAIPVVKLVGRRSLSISLSSRVVNGPSEASQPVPEGHRPHIHGPGVVRGPSAPYLTTLRKQSLVSTLLKIVARRRQSLRCPDGLMLDTKRRGQDMAAYAIMRCKKLAKMGNVAASLKHAYRERETPNADASRTPDNDHWAASSTDEAMGRLRELLPEKRRKDAVLAIEYVMTASPEWWKSASQEQQAAFFDKAHKWLADKYGADRIVTASIHRDETSPHMTAFVVPLTQDGRLSAKEFIGNKAQMTRDQTTFAAAVADLGLQRGIEGSKARHTRIQAFYEALERPPVGHATIEASAVQPKVLRKGIFSKDVETPDAVAERLTKAVRKGYEPAVIAAAGAREMAQKAKQAQETARDLRDRLKPVLEALGPLSKDMQAKAAAIIKAVGEKLLAEQKEQQRQKLAERQRNKPSRGHDRGR